MKREKRFGYSRSISIPVNCDENKSKRLCSADIINNNSETDIVQKYLTKQIDLECLESNPSVCTISADVAAKKIASILSSLSITKIISILKSAEGHEAIAAKNIPQYGDLSIAMYLVPVLLTRCEPIGYVALGKKLFFKEGKRDDAYRKYGENHSKLAAMLDLATITKVGNSEAIVSSSPMGRVFADLPPDNQDQLLPRLCLRIPVVQNAVISTDWKNTVNEDLSILSPTTKDRRMRDVIELVQFVLDE